MPEAPGAPPKTPRWVKVSAIVVGVLLVLIVVAKLIGFGGDHGPGRHMSGDAAPVVAVIPGEGDAR